MQMEAQAVPTMIHYHHAWLIWAIFFIGEMLHFSLQIDESARLSKLSRWTVAERGAITFLFRGFFAALVFGIIWQHPELVGKLAALVGHPIGNDENSVFALPMNNSIAGLYGMFLDSLFGYIPGLKSKLPQTEQWDGTDRRSDPVPTPAPVPVAQPTVTATKPAPPWPDVTK